MMKSTRVVIFISGNGSNMEALIEAAHAPDFPAQIVAVICDTATAGGVEKAKAHHIDTFIFARSSYTSKLEHEGAILAQLTKLRPDLICLAGYMRLLSPMMIDAYRGKILNIHPSLLPLFPGLNTHQRALDAGVKIAGCTVHLVTQEMDAGPILAQAGVPVLATDTAATLANRVLKAEHWLYPTSLAHFITKKPYHTDENQSIFSLL